MNIAALFEEFSNDEEILLAKLNQLSPESWHAVNDDNGEAGPFIHQAIEHEFYQVVQLLLNNGASVDIVDSLGMTPLMLAADEGHLPAIKIILEPTLHHPEKLFHLLSALQKKSISTYYSVLSGKGQKNTALMLAVKRRNLLAVDLILSYMKHLSLSQRIEILKIANKQRQTALMIAATTGHTEIFKHLLDLVKEGHEKSYSPLLKTVSDMTSLIIAVEHNHPEIVEAILASFKHTPMDVTVGYLNRTDVNGNTALMLAVIYQHPDMIKMILDSLQEADSTHRLSVYNKCNAHYETPLLLAVKLERVESVKMLIMSQQTASLEQQLAMLNVENYLGETPLMLAAKLGNQEILDMLLSSFNRIGESVTLAVLDAKNHNGETVIDLARKYHAELADRLLSLTKMH